MKRYAVLALFLASLFPAGFAGTYDHSQGGLSIWFPDRWNVTIDEGLLEATSPDGEAYAQLFVLDDVATIDEAIDIYGDELDQVVSNFRPSQEEGQEISHNGLSIFLLDGEGEVDGVTLEIGVALIVSEKAVTMMITFNSKAAAIRFAEDFKRIVMSLKAI